jgi:hypothetical protein
MIWLLFIVLSQEPVDVHVLEGTFETKQECQDAMIAHVIMAGFSGQEFKAAYCEETEYESR